MQPTVEILLEVAEGEYAIVLPHANRKARLVVVVHQALHEHLFVGPSSPDLQPLQLQQLLEDPPLQVVPADVNISRKYHFLRRKRT
jgi:hypothetical protein